MHDRRVASAERSSIPQTAGDERAALALRLLGGFAVAIAGREIAPAAWRVQKAQSLVKLLALAPGQRLGRDHLLDLLWPDLDPEAATNNFHRTLHAARRALDTAGGAGALPLRQGILALDHPGGVRIDVADFESASAVARRTRTPADYQHALALYTGDLLPEDRYEDWAAPRREALRQTYLALLLDLARLSAGGGDYAAAIAALNRAVAHDPAYEEAHAELMRAYALAGQREEALRQYARLRTVLQRELDAEPESLTQALYGAILARRLAPAPPESGPAAPPPPTGGHNLPASLTSFIGRRGELTAIEAALATTRLLSLVGPPGSGKTRLALAVAERVLPSYSGGTWLVELAPLADPALVPGAVAAALGVREQPGRDLLSALVDTLRARTLLLVLDNCEHLTDACAQLAAALLTACPDLRILATSRAVLLVPGELVWRVPPLTLPTAGVADVAAVAASEAAQLLVDRARWRQPNFALEAGNAAAVDAICRQLDGLPLALELAAGRLPTLTMGQLAARLGGVLGVLGAGGTGVPERQRTLRATLDWSHSLLADDARVLFRRLAVFAGGWTLEAAEAVCAGEGLAVEAILELLANLVDQSLVVAEPGATGVRYRLLEVVRQYVRERLVASGEVELLQDRHATSFLALGEEAEPHLAAGGQVPWLERLETEHDNLRAALAWALEGARAGDARRAMLGANLGSALALFWLVRGYLSEGRDRLEVLLAADHLLAPIARARVLTVCGMLASNQGDRAGAVARLEASLPLWREVGDRRGLATALRHRASILLPQGDLAGARELLEESLALCRAAGDRHGAALAGSLLARVALIAGDYPATEARCEASLVVLRELGDDTNGALTMTTLGVAALYSGDSVRAGQLFAEGLELYRRIGSDWGIADTLSLLGWSLLFQGDLARAIALCEESAKLCRTIGDRGIEAAALTGQGLALLFAGDERAGVPLAASLPLWRDQGNDELAGYCLIGLAGVAGLQGQGGRAALILGAAEALRERRGIPLRPVAGQSYARIVALAHTGLNDTAFIDAWARGRTLPATEVDEAALAVGLSLPGQRINM